MFNLKQYFSVGEEDGWKILVDEIGAGGFFF